MSSTPRIPTAEITGPFGYLVKRFSRKMLGEVPGPLGVVCGHHRNRTRGEAGRGE